MPSPAHPQDQGAARRASEGDHTAARIWLYNLAWLLASPLLFGAFVLPWIFDRRVREGHAYRCGLRLPAKPRRSAVWLHAVSVGEVSSLQRLIGLVRAAGHYEAYLSTTTATGFATAQRLYRDTVTLFYFPLDLPFVLRRFFDVIRPAAVMVAEVEIWPNFLETARRRSVPVFLINGRIGDKELAGYRPLRWFLAPFFATYRRIFAQSEGDRARMIEIGMPGDSIAVSRNLKADADFRLDAGWSAVIQRLIPTGRMVIVAGSTHPSEERLIVEACRSLRSRKPFLVIAPRAIGRGEEIQEVCTAHGFSAALFSQIMQDQPATEISCDALIVNTMGDLPYFYQGADIVIMGGSFSAQIGGHNFLEPLQFAKPVIVGPCMHNFSELERDYLAGGGIWKVESAGQIGAALEDLIRDPDRRTSIGAKGHELLLASRGGSEETYAAIFGESGLVE